MAQYWNRRGDVDAGGAFLSNFIIIDIDMCFHRIGSTDMHKELHKIYKYITIQSKQ